MGKKAIRKIIVIWFAGLATFGVLANDLLHVSAPILAVELDGSEALPNVQEPVAPNSVSSFATVSEVETANQPDVPPRILSDQNPVAEEAQQPVAVEPELEIKSDVNETVHESGIRVQDRSVLFTSDWIDISPAKIEKAGFSPGEPKTYFADRLATGSEVGVLTAAGLEPVKRTVRSPAPLFPPLKAVRPSLFGTIVNRKLPSQPTRPALSSLPRLSAETVSLTKTEAKAERWVSVKHEAKTSVIFAATALHASTLIAPARTAVPRQFLPVLEGPNAINLTVFSKVAQSPVPVSVLSSISAVKYESEPLHMLSFTVPRLSSPILEGPSAIDLTVLPRLATRSAPMEVRVMPAITRLSSAILEEPSAIDLTVFPRLATGSAPMEVRVMPAITRLSSTILEGPSAIELTVFSRVAPRPVEVSVLPTISTVTHESTLRNIYDFASSRASLPIVEWPSAIDLTVFSRLSAEPRPVAVSVTPSISSSAILEGPSAIDLTVFPRLIPKSQPLAVSVMPSISSSPILEGPNAIDLTFSARLATQSRPVPASLMAAISSPPILEGPNAIDLSVFPRLYPKSHPVAVRVLPSISSPAILEGPSAIDLSVFPRFSDAPVAARVMPSISSPILEGPSAIELTVFPRLATKSLPVLPVAVPYSIVSNDTQTAAAAFSHVPVLISGQTAFSQAMLRPLDNAAQQSNAAVADSFVASNRGPSADSFANALDTRRAVVESAKLPTAPSPVLITGQTGFSTEMLKPLNPNRVQAKPFNVSTPLPSASISGMPKQVAGYCDQNFVGEPIRFSQTVELKLEDLLNQLNARFGINFILGQNVAKIPLNVKAGSIPWNVLLRSQLFVSGVRARCIDPTTIELVLNRDLPTLQDGAAVTSRFVKLKYLQRTSGGTVDLANRSQGGQNGGQGGCGGGQSGGSSSNGGGGGGGQSGQTAGQQGSNRFDQLVVEIEKILGLRSMNGGSNGGGNGGASTEEIRSDRSVTQIPGRNILVIKATEDEHALIDEIIARADRPPFQVVIKALVYSANQDLLRDIGVQASIRGGNGSGRTNGGVLGDTLGVGTLFDFSTIIGTFDFNVQMTALQQNGIISVKSRPFATVLDGLCTKLSVGTKLPIVIDSTLGGQGGITILDADNTLAVTPYVVDDENGNPIAVTLELNLQANVIDSSITARGVPAVNVKNIQTQLLLAENKTAILGGFSIDQDSKSFSKVPGLGDIPLLGELFKRRIRDKRLSRLYFAISVDVIPYPEAIAPVVVPGATTDPQTITEEMKKRAEEAEAVPKKKKKDN